MIPSLEHKEWRELLSGTYEPRLTSHLLKIKINTLRQKIKRKMISLEDAIQELRKDCELHEDIYQNDLYKIFQRADKNVR